MKWFMVSLVVLIVGGGGWWWASHRPPPQRSTPTPAATELPEPAAVKAVPTIQRLSAVDVPNVASEFRWSAEVPIGWEAEAVSEVEAINIYNPAAPGSSNLEKSQIFVRHFESNSFLALTTVEVLSRSELTVGGRPAIRYDIEKKAGVADFAHQPSWRNQRHIVTDVRVSDTNPSVFYVIAKNPDLDQVVYDRFLETFQVSGGISSGVGPPVPSTVEGDSPEVAEPSSLADPIAEFKERITKKPFGIHITPQNSPVQPERFSGYHTGVDVEYGDPTSPDGSDGASVPIYAVVDATVVQASYVSGYGGLLVLKGSIDGQPRYFLYGHVRLSSLPSAGTAVKQGDQIGVLGTAGAETGGERKHLHFSIYKNDPVNLRGYVQSQGELAAWIDPGDLYR